MDNRNEELVNAVYRHNLFECDTEVKLSFVNYSTNGTLALQLLSRPEYDEFSPGEELPFEEPYATVTVNLPESDRLAANEQFVDENNLPGIGDWLVENGIARPTEYSARSGYCTYQAYAFNVTDKILSETVSRREDSIADNLISLIEQSGLKYDEKNERGELYNLNTGSGLPTPIIIYRGTDPENMGRRNDVFLLATHREKGEQMWRFRNLPQQTRREVAEAIGQAIRQSRGIRR